MRPQGSPAELERRRRRAMQLLDGGLTLSAVARMVGAAVSAVWQWRETLRRRGPDGLAAKPAPGRPRKLTERQRQRVPRLLRAGARAYGFSNDLWTARRIATVLEQHLGVAYHPAHVSRLLADLGWTYQKPERRALERDDAAIAHWKRHTWVQVKKKPGAWAYLVFLDESGFLLVPSVRRTWAPRGETPRLVHRYQRDKISAISAVTVSPTHRRLGFYCHLHLENITHVEVAVFLRLLLRHLRGPIILLWDGGSIHGGADVRQVLARHPRLQVHRFPAYAPELNPDELAWGFLKDELANGCPLNVEALLDDLTHLTRRLRRSPRRLRGFVLGSDLPPLFSS